MSAYAVARKQRGDLLHPVLVGAPTRDDAEDERKDQHESDERGAYLHSHNALSYTLLSRKPLALPACSQRLPHQAPSPTNTHADTVSSMP